MCAANARYESSPVVLTLAVNKASPHHQAAQHETAVASTEVPPAEVTPAEVTPGHVGGDEEGGAREEQDRENAQRRRPDQRSAGQREAALLRATQRRHQQEVPILTQKGATRPADLGDRVAPQNTAASVIARRPKAHPMSRMAPSCSNTSMVPVIVQTGGGL